MKSNKTNTKSQAKYLKSNGWLDKEENGSTLWKNPKWKSFDKYIDQEMAVSLQLEDDEFEKEFGKN